MTMLTREYLLIVALVLVAWLTAGGMAVRSVSRIWLRHWAEQRLRGAATALAYLERPQRLLAAAAAGVALVLVLSGVLLGLAHDGAALAVAIAAYAVLVIALGQIVPRAVARVWAAPLVPLTLPVLRVAEIAAAPFASLGRLVVDRREPGAATAPADAERDAIHELLREGELEGVGEHDEIAIINGVFEFGEKVVRDVMTPRADVFALDASTEPRSLARRIAQSAYSRVPIYRGSLDNVIGMLHAFDVLKTRGEQMPPLRPVAHTSPDAPCNALLMEMLRDRRHLAIVRDVGSGGHTLGLVTLEDLLEELVGDIHDEHDEPAPPVQVNAPAGGAPRV
ncbi:MAG TPA: CNNM domain-containing protein [Gemmatimonadaceae bacterium]|nr:CNNM domain-containing protein [Gemmatimonadaceae bacterium]